MKTVQRTAVYNANKSEVITCITVLLVLVSFRILETDLIIMKFNDCILYILVMRPICSLL